MSNDAYERAKRAAAESGRRVRSSHPARWPLPKGEAARDAYERDLSDWLNDITEDDIPF